MGPACRSFDQLPCTHLTTLIKDADLFPDLVKLANDLDVAVDKPVDGIGDLDVVAKLSDQLLRPAEVVSRDPWVEVVDGLELQAAVHEVEPGRAVDIHGRAEHTLREAFVGAQIGRAHGEMRERDLHVQRAGDHVADHDEDESVPRGRDGKVQDKIAVPCPEDELAEDFEMAVPFGRSVSGT